jgi:hypothetical protein
VVDTSRMRVASRALVDLLSNDVHLLLVDRDWNMLWQFSSDTNIDAEFRSQLGQIRAAISNGEESIRQLNMGWRMDELLSFRLICHASRIFVFLFADSYKLVILNRFDPERGPPEDGPDFDTRLREIRTNIQNSITALAPAHN